MLVKVFQFQVQEKVGLGLQGHFTTSAVCSAKSWGGGGAGECGHVQSHGHVSSLCRLTGICLQTLNSHLF